MSQNKTAGESYKKEVLTVLSAHNEYELTNFPHYPRPNSTLYLNETGVDEFSIATEVRTKHPRILLSPSDEHVVQAENIVLAPVEEKNRYVQEVKRLTSHCSRNENCMSRKPKSDVYPMNLEILMELTVSDPDPYFFGAYNWFYTGGALETISANDIDFVFYVTGPNLNIFNSGQIISKKNGLKIKHLDSTKMSQNGCIYEIVKSIDSRYIAARQREQISIFYLQDECAQQDLPCSKNIPLISGDFLRDNFYSIDAKRLIKRFNLHRGKDTGTMRLTAPSNRNHWSQLKRYNDQLIFADQRRIKIYDSRQFGRKESRIMEMCFDNLIERCEDITCIHADSNENNLLVSTTHHTFVFDVRFVSENNSQLARYTHQMKTPPLSMDVIGGGVSGTVANERLITLSGTFDDDIVIAQHTKNQHDKCRTNSVPMKVLSTLDSSELLKRKGYLDEAKKIMENNNRQVNIGTKFIRSGSKLYLLTAKGSAELFYQEIYPKEDYYDDSDDEGEKLLQYLPTPPTQTDSSFSTTALTNFSYLKNILKYELPSVEEIPDIEGAAPFNRWERPFEKLATYKDMLSADLLAVWDIKSLSNQSRMSSSLLVSGWLQNTTNENIAQDDDINVSD